MAIMVTYFQFLNSKLVYLRLTPFVGQVAWPLRLGFPLALPRLSRPKSAARAWISDLGACFLEAIY